MLAARPTVAVEVHLEPTVDAAEQAQLTALRGWLVRRLLEEGYDVAANERGAHGVVHVRRAEGGLVVDAVGRGQRSFVVEEGPEAVLRLELLHRALMGVEQTCDPSEPVASPEPGLALRFVEGSRHDDFLEAMAVVTLHSGVTLTRDPAPSDTLACITQVGSLAEVGLGLASEDCAPASFVLDLGDGSPEVIRGAARSVVDAMRAPDQEPDRLDLDTVGGPPAADLAAPPPLRPVVEDDLELAPMQGPPRAEMRLISRAGVALRGAQVDPLFQAGWRMGKIHGAGARLSVSMTPSGASAYTVLDTRLAVGPDWEFQAGERGHIDVAALIGTDLHAFNSGDRTGSDMAFAAELPVTYAFTVRKRTRLLVTIDPGVASTAWDHRVGAFEDSRVVWSRPAWRVGFMFGISHGWRIE